MTTDHSLLPRNNPSSSGTENFYDLVVCQLKGCASVNPHCEFFPSLVIISDVRCGLPSQTDNICAVVIPSPNSLAFAHPAP